MWKNEPPTKKQISSIYRMQIILGWKVDLPKTKGEASNLIRKMSSEINLRIATTGSAFEVSECIEVFDEDED